MHIYLFVYKLLNHDSSIYSMCATCICYMYITCLHPGLTCPQPVLVTYIHYYITVQPVYIPQYYMYILFYFILFYFIYILFYSYIFYFCTILCLCLRFSFFSILNFFYTFCMSIVGGNLKTKNFIASHCFTVIVAHMTNKKLGTYLYFTLLCLWIDGTVSCIVRG